MSTVTFEDLDRMKTEILQQTAPNTLQDQVIRLQGWKRKLDQDSSFGRIFNGPQWLDKVAIRDGNITAAKLEANLVISNTFISGAESPADRMELTASGLAAYGTVSGTPNTKTLHIHETGNFEFGKSPNQITFVASTGVLTVPAAVITSLTIAAVGSGTIGGTYGTGGAGARMELSTAGIKAYNSTPTQTFFLDASNGNFTMVGNFTIGSSAAGTDRISMTQGGIELWKAGTREFYLQAGGATNAVSMLLTGPSAGQYIGMAPDTGLWLGASTFATASFKVTNAGALTATSASVSGAITATSGSFSGVTISGALTMGASGLIRTGTGNPRLEMDNTGLYAYNASGVVTAEILSSGYGYLGSAGAILWGLTGGVVTTTVGSWIATSTAFTDATGATGMSGNGLYSFWAGNATPASAPFRVKPSGEIAATSGTIGGWTLGSTTLTGTNTTLDSAGALTLGTTTNIVKLSSTDSTARIWVGDTSSASAPFYVTPAGILHATGAVISGSGTFSGAVTATSGTFAGVDITGTLKITGSGEIIAENSAGSSDKVRMYSGGITFTRSGGATTGWIKTDGSGFLGKTASFPLGTIIWDNTGSTTIAGWTLTDTQLSSGTGGSFVAMSSGTFPFWSGAASAGTAPFYVKNDGELHAAKGDIGGWTLATTSLSTGSGATERGMSTGATAFYAGSSTPSSAPFRVTSGGAMTATSATITGTINLPNGGTITTTTVDINGGSSGAGTFSNMSLDGTTTITTGGKIVDADGSQWDNTGITLVSSNTFGDTIKWVVSGSDKGSIWASTTVFKVGANTGINLLLQGPDTGTTLSLATDVSLGAGAFALFDGKSSDGSIRFYNNFYPGAGGATQSTRYINDNGTYMRLNGPISIANSTVGGSAANWSSGSPVGAAYVKVYVNGVLSRIPFWADA